MDFVERETVTRMKNLADSLVAPTATDNEASTGAAFLDLPPKDLKRYSITRGIAAMLNTITQGVSNFGARHTPGAPQAPVVFDGLEGECHRELEKKLGPVLHGGGFRVPTDCLYKRDLNVAVGGYLVATKLGSLIEHLRNVSVAFRLGAQRVSGQVGNLTLPKQVGNGTAVWLPVETTQVAESNATFTQVTGVPKTCGVYQEISRQLLKQISADTEAAVKRSLASNLALTVDQAALTGSGASGQPTGIINTPGIGGFSGTSLAVAGLIDIQTDLAEANSILNPATLGYATTPLVAKLLKTRPDFVASVTPVWKGAIHQGIIEGVPSLSSKQLPADTMLYGDWSNLIIAEWGTLVVEVDPFTQFKSGIVGVRSLWTVDVMVQHPSAFTLISSIT